MKDIERFENVLKGKIITKIYSGRDSGCRCGCHGRYYAVGDEGFGDVLEQAKQRIEKSGAYFYDNGILGFVNVPYGRDKAFTVYYE